jgi:transcriptional regulator with XRE-family HTH domain
MAKKSDDINWLSTGVCVAVKNRRQEIALSQEELSRRSGLHRTYISDVERGSRNLSLKNLQRLAEALETRPSDLIAHAEIIRKP